MKAYEAKKKAFKPNYDKIISEIEIAATKGEYAITTEYIPNDVLCILINDDGYDIKKFIHNNYVEYVISFENAEEGRIGTFTSETID